MTATPGTGAEGVARAIQAHGNARVFLYPGDTIAPTVNALRALGLELVVTRHEQGAGYAALAQGRLDRRAGVVMVTSGPGVTNLLTPLADAWYDSTPLVAITGQVGTADLSGRPGVRQRGFQEVATPDLVAPISKACLRPLAPVEAEAAIERAFQLAESGRPGPVVVDLPMDVQRGAVEGDPGVAPERPARAATDVDALGLDQLAELLETAERPVLLAGRGVLLSDAGEALRVLAERMDAPVCTSLLGVGAINGEHPLAIGFIGHTGMGWANRAVHASDLLVAIGARLDVRQTGTQTDAFVPEGRVVRIDLDAAELSQGRVRCDLALRMDARAALEGVLARDFDTPRELRKAWWSRVLEWRTTDPLDPEPRDGRGCSPAVLLRRIDDLTSEGPRVVATGVGHHQQWVARHMRFAAPERPLLTSGGHGAMGYDLPSALGAACARPDATVLCVVGDGSFQLNMQELGTVAEYGLPVKIAVLDNRRLAMVSQFQQITWGDDPTTGDRAAFDFVGFARLYGMRTFTLERLDERAEGVLRAFLGAPGPALLHASIDPRRDVVPMLLAGQEMDAMWWGERARTAPRT